MASCPLVVTLAAQNVAMCRSAIVGSTVSAADSTQTVLKDMALPGYWIGERAAQDIVTLSSSSKSGVCVTCVADSILGELS